MKFRKLTGIPLLFFLGISLVACSGSGSNSSSAAASSSADTSSSTTVESPVFSPLNGETFTDTLAVTITSATAGSIICYTTDGTVPTSSSTQLASPATITLSATTTVHAIAIKTGMNNSAAVSATFTKKVTGDIAEYESSTTFGYTVSVDVSTNAVTSSSSGMTVTQTSSTLSTLSLNGSDVITVAQGTYGLVITSDMPDNTYVNFSLSGTVSGKALTIYSAEKFKLTLNGVSITSTDGPAINIQSDVKAFVVSAAGTTNTLVDSSKYTTQYLPTSSTTAMDLKGCFFSEGPLVFSGTGSLSITGNKKHALASDRYLRIVEGTYVISATVKDGIRLNDAFVMDSGTLTITTTAGKGIKVDGVERTSPMGYIVFYGGTVTITSYDKAITAAWETAEDATTTSTADDPTPYVTINGGTFTIKTTGTPVEDTATTDGLSPEGIESKTNLTINAGTFYITTTDDCINAGSNITINGGSIYAAASANDAIDSNGTMTITGGLIIAMGANGAEGGLDCDENTFKVTGGTFIGLGGRNSTPTASSCTQNCVSLSSVNTANTLLAVTDSGNNVVFAFAIPSGYTPTVALLSTPSIITGTTYKVLTGATVASYTSNFKGLYTGTTVISGGTQKYSFTPSTYVTTVK